MASSLRWQDPEGIETIQAIVKKRVSQWKTGLRSHQLDAITRILDRRDVLYCVATGQGKSASFMVPLLVHHELHESPALYPSFASTAKEAAVGVVVTPTKGLATSLVRRLIHSLVEIQVLRYRQVKEAAECGLRGFAYCHETLTEARKSGRSLVNEIGSVRHPLGPHLT